MSDGTPVLDMSGVSKTFSVRNRAGSTSVAAVNDVSLRIDAGETVGLVGESGSGKSTTGRLALRLIEPDQGSVHIGGVDVLALRTRELRALRRTAQIIFQDPMGSLDPLKTVGDSIAEPLATHFGWSRGRCRDEVQELLGVVDLDGAVAGRYPAQLSGGMRQRAAIARAIGLQPDLIVCDEPTSALDASTQATIINLLRRLSTERRVSYLFISHDLAMVRHLADRVAVMYLGRIVETAPAAELFADPRHPYTRSLLAALPSIRASKGSMAERSGPTIGQDTPTRGCPYRPRCPLAEDRCADVSPQPVTVGVARTVSCHVAALASG